MAFRSWLNIRFRSLKKCFLSLGKDDFAILDHYLLIYLIIMINTCFYYYIAKKEEEELKMLTGVHNKSGKGFALTL